MPLFQIFKCKFVVFCVETDKWMIAEMLLRQNYTTEETIYLGEFSSINEVYKSTKECNLEFVNKDICLNYMKGKSLVRLMKIYWDKFVEEKEKL